MNFVIMMADQLRADFLSCYGASFIKTPNIDALRDEGVLYKRALSPSPLCIPARAALMTGMNGMKTGVISKNGWFHPDREMMGIRTWPEQFRDEGYETIAIGKMHFTPWDAGEGFMLRKIAEDKRHIHIKDDYADYLRSYGYEKLHGKCHEGYYENKGAIISQIPAEHQVDSWVTQQTCRFIQSYKGVKPFALMVGFPGPHCPYDPPKELKDLYADEDMPESIPETSESEEFKEEFVKIHLMDWNGVDYRVFTEPEKKKLRSHYAALVHQIDQCVGKIVKALKDQGLYEDTVIVFTSDHGDLLGDFGFVGKSLFYESSIRVPLILRHPHHKAPSEIDNVVSLTDLYATLLTMAGLKTDGGTNDSRPLYKDGLFVEKPREYVFGCLNTGFMIADNEWKLCKYKKGETLLFHNKTDEHEQVSLAQHPHCLEQFLRLDRLLTKELLHSIPVGHKDKLIPADENYYNRGWVRPYPAG